jgi:hypothetical protein
MIAYIKLEAKMNKYILSAKFAMFFLIYLGLFLNGDNADSLFKDASNVSVESDYKGQLCIRSRLVEINTDIIEDNGPARLNLDLFEDVQYTAVFIKNEHVSSDSTSWIGYIEGDRFSEVVLVKKGKILIGTVQTSQGLYEIRYVEGSIHSIIELDRNAFDDKNDTVPVTIDPSADSPSYNEDSGDVIAVLVLYTEAAKNGAGGASAMKAEIDLAISHANAATANSLINMKFALVHHTQVSYDETNAYMSDALMGLIYQNDGIMDSVHNIRQQYGADVVVLLANDLQGGSGISALMQNLDHAFRQYAFSVVKRQAISGYTFHHEIGHNMGCEHDRANAEGGGIYSYSYGYQDPSYDFRTIMAYSCVQNCPRINYFSNPNVNYNGEPTGIPQSSSISADNALTITNTKYTVANFFDSSNVPPSFNTNFDTITIREGETLTLDFSATDFNGDAVTYSMNTVPGGAVFTAVTAQFSWTTGYTQAGTYLITASASDGKNIVNQTVPVVVTNVKRINH